MDFTTVTYKKLLTALQAVSYPFQSMREFFENPKDKAVLIRHDVDRLPKNALKMAQLEHKLGVAATYYFRAVPDSWDKSLRDG